MKRVLIFGVCVMLVISLASMVMAVDRRSAISGSTPVTGVSTAWNETVAGSDVAQGGNVTHMNLSTTASTVKWQGYHGRVSATLGLGVNGNAKRLYSFGSAITNQIKAVFASTDSLFDFANLRSAVALTRLDTAMGWASSDSDSGNKTFGGGASASNKTTSRITKVQSANLNSYTIIANASGSGNPILSGIARQVSTVFRSGVLADIVAPVTLGDFAFAVQVNSSLSTTGVPLNRNFLNASGAGGTVDYELIVPVNSTAQQGESPIQKTYYFFLDIE